jgi:hypothetical protein
MVYGLRSYTIGRHGWVSASTLLWRARLVAAATSKAIVLSLGILHRFTYLGLGRERSSEARRAKGIGGRSHPLFTVKCALHGACARPL